MSLKITVSGQTYAPTDDAVVRVTDAENEPENQNYADFGDFIDWKKLLSLFDAKFKSRFNTNESSRNQKNSFFSEYLKTVYFGGIAGVARIKIDDLGAVLSDEALFELSGYEELGAEIILNITTKFDNKENQPYFLATMLLEDKFKLSDNTVPENLEALFDILLLYRFRERLEEAVQKGFFRAYRRFERNDSRLKGSIDIARHIRENVGRDNGRIAYSYRENTENNCMNALIVAAYDHLKNKYYEQVFSIIDSNYDLFSAVSSLRRETGYSREMMSSVIREASRKPIAHPYFIEYEELRVTCLRILRDEGVSIFDGTDDDVEAILWYVPDLWENYVERKLGAYYEPLINDNYTMESQKELKVFSDTSDKNYMITTRPDYVFCKKEKPVMVLDAKFRPIWESIYNGSSKEGSKIEDDYTKCLRDMVDFGCHITGTLFPAGKLSTVGLNKTAFVHRISKYNDIDKFLTIPFLIPEIGGRSYTEWANELEDNAEEAIKKLNEASKPLLEHHI